MTTSRRATGQISRRNFLRATGTAAGGIALATPLSNLQARQASGAASSLRPEHGFGPLEPVADETTGLPLLKLPRGFSYQSFGWTGDVMDDGTLTPDRHDGMAVVDLRFSFRRGLELVLIRNHERGAAEPGNPLPFIGGGLAPTYDGFTLPGLVDGIGGGTTELYYGFRGFTGSTANLAGTLVNCAGGPTPWGSWLTCEETTIRGSVIGAADHGYVFEVPSPRHGPASARPIVEMGFMDHEAVAVDPRRGDVYLTEDNGPNSGFYRYRPNDARPRVGALEKGGRLEMLKVAGVDNADLREVTPGERFDVEWVPIPEPNADPEGFSPPAEGLPPIEGVGRSGPFLQGEAAGAAIFARGEGCWYSPSRGRGVVYFVDTSGGPAGKGVVWALELAGGRRGRGRGRGRRDRLTAIFVSPSEEVADNPDNITVSPRGGIVVCEDGGGQVIDGERTFGTRLLGIRRNGRSFVFAENNIVIDSALPDKPFIAPDDYRGREFAGATFSPFGSTLFVNIQTPGITFAIRGPWWRGGL